MDIKNNGNFSWNDSKLKWSGEIDDSQFSIIVPLSDA